MQKTCIKYKNQFKKKHKKGFKALDICKNYVINNQAMM